MGEAFDNLTGDFLLFLLGLIFVIWIFKIVIILLGVATIIICTFIALD